MKKIFYMIIALSLFSCKQYKPLQTVNNVDIEKYAGKWYEIAAFPQVFQKGCSCSSAEYFTTSKNYVKVVNTCTVDGKQKKVEGKAFIVKGTGNSKLKVQFFWPFKGKYWIIYLENDYSIAVVGHPNRQYLWILARDKKISEEKYNSILEFLKNNDFDISKLVKTVHVCS
ncbi:MAG TPA: lipocalin family protein [Bacteroidales bacterium]|nr:lipocalin family protein [Bacteroidales bacterium]HPS17740.1 lipocalin family protein [Bacteroidales bacterium]